MSSDTQLLEHDSHLSSVSSNGKWLQVVSHVDGRFGGITAAVPELSQAVARAGVPVAAAAFCDNDEEAGPLWNDEPRRFPPSRLTWLTVGGLKSDLRALLQEVDGVHIHGLWEAHCAVVAQACRALRKPYVVSAHGMLEQWALRNKGWKKRLYAALIENRNLAGAACLHALTDAEVGDYRRIGLTNPIAVVPNGIHVPAAIGPNEFLNRHPELRGRDILLFLSRVHFKKGLDILIEAWSHVAQAHPRAQLVIAGPDSEGTKSAIEEKIRGLDITNRVTFTGMLKGSEKWSALAAAHTYVLPSYSEGFSVAILEAMAAGKPVIVTEQCNVPEVKSAACGWTIQPCADELRSVIAEALSTSHAELDRIGERGRKLVEFKFTWTHCGGEMAQVYGWLGGGFRPSCVRSVA